MLADRQNKSAKLFTPKRIGGILLIVLLAVLLVITSLFLSACAQEDYQASEALPASSSSEYSQTVIEFPEDVYIVEALERTGTGNLWMVGTKTNGETNGQITSSLWELSEDGSWNELVDLNELLSLGEGYTIGAASVTSKNEVVCMAMNLNDRSSNIDFFVINPAIDSDFRKLDVDASTLVKDTDYAADLLMNAKLCPLEDDRILIQTFTNSLYILDVSNETITHIPPSENSEWWLFLDAVEVGGTLYVLYEDQGDGYSIRLSTLDVSSGEYHAIENEELNNLLEEYGANSPARVMPALGKAQDSAEGITICLIDGIIEYDANEARIIATSEGTILADTSKDVEGYVPGSNGAFCLLGMDPFDSDPSPYSLYEYTK